MENLNLISRKKFTMDKFLTQIKVTTDSEIKRVIDAKAVAVISSKDSSNGMISVTGKLNLGLVYVSVDGLLERAEASVDFIQKQQTSFVLDDLYVEDNPVAVNVNFSGTEAIVSVEHKVTVFGSYNYSLGENFNDESLVLNKKSFSSLKLVKSVEDSFVVAEEVESNLANVVVLASVANALALEVTSGVDKIVVEGKVLVGVTYKDSETTGYLQKEFEFKQEISAEGVVPNMITNAKIEVCSVTVTPEEKENKTNFVYAIDLHSKAFAYEESTYEVVTDMFSLNKFLTTTTDYVETKNYVETKFSTENIMASTNVSEIEKFDDILGVFEPYFELVGVENNDNKVTLNGTIHAYALYLADNDLFRLDIAENISLEMSKEPSNIASFAGANVEISSFKVKAGKELETNFKINFQVDLENIVSENFVKSYEVKEDRPAEKGGITVYVAGNSDTLFEVAKAVGVRPEEIAKQNDNTTIFEKGEKIYIYSPINLM